MKRTLSFLLVLAAIIVAFVEPRSSVPLPVAFFKPASATSSDPTLTITNGLIARWEADNITGLSDGASITNWPDSSGNGRYAEQLTLTPDYRPVFKTNLFGSKPAVRFDGSDDNMNFTLATATNFTVVVAWQLKSVANWVFGPLRWRNSTGAGFALQRDNTVDTSSNPVKRLMVWNAGGTVIAAKDGPDEGLSLPGTPRAKAIDTWRWDGTTATLRKNGSAQSVTDGSAFDPGGSVSANIGQPVNYCGADVAAILVYDTALSDADVLEVEAYLNTKYPCF